MKPIYNKETKVADLIEDNATPPSGWTDQPPRWTEFEAWDYDNDCWGESLLLMKGKKSSEITQAFEDNFSNGHFMSSAIGIEVDCRRAEMKNDLQNVQGLISYMNRNSIPSINYVGYSEIKQSVTSGMLTALLAEMEDYALQMYEKKWTLLQQVESAATKEDLGGIQW